MRRGQVAYVNVVTHAGAVRSWIVRAKNLQLLAGSSRDLQRDGDQVRFGPMILALLAGSARRVEITQTRVMQSMNAMQPGEHLLDQQFRFTVSICRLQSGIFFDRTFFWRSV